MNKAVEVYNGTGTSVNLNAYELAIFFNGSTSPGATITLSGTLADGDVYVIADDGADSEVLSAADLTPSNNFFNGDDAVVLRTSGGATVDIIGQVGVDPGSEWESGGVSTRDNTIRRLEAACTGDTTPGDAFDPSTDYAEHPENTFGGLGAHQASCSGDGSGPQLVISEIMYNPASNEDAWEWVEIYNAGASAVDLAGYVLDDNNSSAHASAVIAGGSVPAGGTAILYNADDLSAADFEAAWGPGINLIGSADWSANALNNSGDQVGLWDSFASYSGDHETHANVVAGVSYDDSGAWPSDDGNGSIYLADLSADPAAGASWALSTASAETPTFDAYQSQAAGGNSGADVGSPGPGFGDGGPEVAVVINEADYDQPGSDNAEFIELYNAGPAPAPLGGLSLELVNGNGGSIYDTVDLPAVSLDPGAFFIVCVDADATPDCNLEVLSSIQNGPDAVGLRDGTELLDALSYEGSVSGYVEETATSVGDNNDDAFVSLSRLPDGTDTDDNDADFSLRCTTPGAANVSDASDCPDPTGPPAPDIAECQTTDYSPQTLHPGLTGQALIDQIIADYKPEKGNMPPDYGAARDHMYAFIDNEDGSVEGVYAGFTVMGVPQDLATARTVAQDGGLNAEHTWPQSLGVGSDEPGARTDLHHLFPVRSNVNSARSNHPFSEIPDDETDRWFINATDQSSIPSSNIDAYSEADFDDGRFEPRERHEGNAARAVFYVAAVYQALVSDPDEEAFFTNQLATLLAWHEVDPTDQTEYVRTCDIAEIQDGKVNPFVIDPTLAERAFGTGVTVSDIDRTPFVPTSSDPTTVTAQVIASSSLSAVELRYFVNGGPETTLSMTGAGGTTYEATIPASAYGEGDRVAYTVHARASDVSDESGTEGFFVGTTPMASINDRDADGILRFLGYGARVQGTATVSAGTFSTSSLDVYLEDTSGGMSLFRGGDTSTPFAAGNRYTVTGTVDQFNGKTQLSPRTITDQGAGTPVTPPQKTIAELLASPEAFENQLVQITNVVSTTPYPSDGSGNVSIQDGTGTLTLRIDGDTGISGADEPDGSYAVTGIFTQFDPTLPLTEGYQIQPRSAADLADIQPPTLTVGADPLVLWPPNHRYHTVSLDDLDLAVSDNAGGSLDPQGVVITEVASDEPDNGRGDGNTTGDVVLDGCRTVRVRAERQGPGDGRVYTLTLAVSDAAGNVGEATYEIQVPKSRKKDATGGSAVYTVEGCKVAEPPAAPTATASSVKDGPKTAEDAMVALSGVARDVPETYALEGNYPNPFRSQTTIRYGMPEAGPVRLVVYDLLGREVRVLVDGQQTAGRHEVRLNGQTLPSGMYIVRMTAGGRFTQVRRMTLVH